MPDERDGDPSRARAPGGAGQGVSGTRAGHGRLSRVRIHLMTSLQRPGFRAGVEESLAVAVVGYRVHGHDFRLKAEAEYPSTRTPRTPRTLRTRALEGSLCR